MHTPVSTGWEITSSPADADGALSTPFILLEPQSWLSHAVYGDSEARRAELAGGSADPSMKPAAGEEG